MPLAIGSISSLFGENLSSQAMLATSLTLPLTLGGASVTLNGIAAPLFYTSSGQINFFVPYELTGQTAATVTVFDAGLAPGFAGLYQMNVVVPTGLRRRRYCCACAEGD